MQLTQITKTQIKLINFPIIPYPCKKSLVQCWQVWFCQYLNGFIGVCNERDEQTEDHVDEQGHKGVEVETTVEPHQVAFLLHVFKGREHVVAIDQGEQALGHSVQCAELKENNGETSVEILGLCKRHWLTFIHMCLKQTLGLCHCPEPNIWGIILQQKKYRVMCYRYSKKYWIMQCYLKSEPNVPHPAHTSYTLLSPYIAMWHWFYFYILLNLE